MKCKPNLKLKDFNFIFADNYKNIQFFIKHLGSSFELGKVPNGSNNKRINFISSMSHEGNDFYPNNFCLSNKAYPCTIIVSEPKTKSMRYDVNTDIVQI